MNRSRRSIAARAPPSRRRSPSKTAPAGSRGSWSRTTRRIVVAHDGADRVALADARYALDGSA
jgi:hypothetical protein